MPINPYIECGKIINTHGCYGGLKLESWCNTPEEFVMLKKLFLKGKNNEYTEAKITKASIFKQFILINLDTVKTMDEAMALKGEIVYARRDDFSLDEGEYFIADLTGLEVIDAVTGTVYGKVIEVINRGASDIYVIETPYGERMIPAVPEYVKRVDINEGVFVTPISGMLD